MSEVNAFKALSLCTTICVGILAVAACTIHLRGDEDQPESERIANTYPTTSIRIISSGSIDGRPMDE